jgi:hypothetical protein
VSALDRRWIRWFVRLVLLAASLLAAVLLTSVLVAIAPADLQWTLMHSGLILLLIPVLTVAFYLVGHLATTRWPWP